MRTGLNNWYFIVCSLGCTLLFLQSVHLKGSAIELLDVMLEETDERSKDLVPDIVNGLDIEALHHTLREFYELMNDQTVKEEGYDDEAEKGLFQTYHALVHMTDYGISPKRIGESYESRSGNTVRVLLVPIVEDCPANTRVAILALSSICCAKRHIGITNLLKYSIIATAGLANGVGT